MCVHDCTWSSEEALDLMARLRAHPTINTVALRHVYREYNADADGVCNQVLDLLLESAAGPSSPSKLGQFLRRGPGWRHHDAIDVIASSRF